MSIDTDFHTYLQNRAALRQLIPVAPHMCTTIKDIQTTCSLFFSASVWDDVVDRPCDSSKGAIVDVIYDSYAHLGHITVTSITTDDTYTAILPHGNFRQHLTTAHVGVSPSKLVPSTTTTTTLYQELLKTPNFPNLADGIFIPITISTTGTLHVNMNHTKAILDDVYLHTGWLHGIVEVMDIPEVNDDLTIASTTPGSDKTYTLYRRSTHVCENIYTFMVCIPDIRDVLVAGRGIRSLMLTFVPWDRPHLHSSQSNLNP